MRKALVRKGFAWAILLAFIAAVGMGCCDACKKSVDEAKMYADQAAASASKADLRIPVSEALSSLCIVRANPIPA